MSIHTKCVAHRVVCHLIWTNTKTTTKNQFVLALWWILICEFATYVDAFYMLSNRMEQDFVSGVVYFRFICELSFVFADALQINCRLRIA